jgi:hypothetical protein
MIERIDMRAGVVAQFQAVDGGRYDVVVGDAVPFSCVACKLMFTDGIPGNTGMPV